MRKVNIKMRRNSKVRSVKVKESETKSRVAKKIQNKRERKWWYETKMSKKRQRKKWGLVVIFNEMPCFTFPFVDRLFKYFFSFNVYCPYGATFFFFFFGETNILLNIHLLSHVDCMQYKLYLTIYMVILFTLLNKKKNHWYLKKKKH